MKIIKADLRWERYLRSYGVPWLSKIRAKRAKGIFRGRRKRMSNNRGMELFVRANGLFKPYKTWKWSWERVVYPFVCTGSYSNNLEELVLYLCCVCTCICQVFESVIFIKLKLSNPIFFKTHLN